MRMECTNLLLQYRELVRLLWNIGFWPNPRLRAWDSVALYKEVAARLFEGMVLLALGYEGRIENADYPGQVADFFVVAKHAGVRLMVDKNDPAEPGHIFGVPVIRLGSDSGPYELKFLRYFDWDLLGVRDFRYWEVLIQRLNDRPDLVGRHGLVEVTECSIWLLAEIAEGPPPVNDD